MAAKEAQSSEISQFVDKMVEKGTKTAQEEQQSRRFEDLAIKSRKKAKMLHSKRQSWEEAYEEQEIRREKATGVPKGVPRDEEDREICVILWKHTGEQKNPDRIDRNLNKAELRILAN